MTNEEIPQNRSKSTLLVVFYILAMVLLGGLLVFAGKVAHAQTVLYVSGSHTGQVWQPQWIKNGWSPTSDGVLSSINIYTNEQDANYATWGTFLTIVDDSTGQTVATSDQTPYRGYDATNVLTLTSFTFSGANKIQLLASKQYTTYLMQVQLNYAYHISVGNDINAGSYDVSTEYMAVYGASPSIVIYSPTSSYATSTTPTFHFQVTLLSGTSFTIAGLYEKDNASGTPISNIYDTNIGGLSTASAGTYDFYGLLNGINDTGDYTNFTFNLLDNSGNVLAQATSSIVVSYLASNPSGGFGQFSYYNGSSTIFYSSHIPNILLDNATPTDFYTSITSVVDNVLNYVYGITASFSQYFSQQNAIQWGNSIKNSFLTVYGYINAFDTYAGGYPFSETIIFFIVAEIALLAIKAVRVLFMR